MTRARRSARPALLLAALALPAIAWAVASCKQESVSTVTLDLGLDNRGSAGFSCTEGASDGCGGALGCVLKPTSRETQLACINAACLQNGAIDPQCAKVTQCLRSDGGTVPECYNATCGSKAPLIERATDGKGGADVHLLVEYIGLGGTPGCRAAELIGWCSTHACRPIRRSCIAVHLDAAALASPEKVSRALADGFGAGRTLDDNAPDQPVLVRILGVAKSGACTAEEESPGPVLTDPVVGCAYSCPTVLTANSGVITVDLDLFTPKCTEEVLRGCVRLFAGDGGIDGGP